MPPPSWRPAARGGLAADRAAPLSGHRQAPLPSDRRAVRHDRARTGHLRLPRARRRGRSRAGDPGEQPVAPMAAAAVGADRELGGVPQRRYRPRELAQRAVGTLAERGSATALRVRRRLRRRGPDDARDGRDARRRHGLLGRPPVGELSDRRGARRRRSRDRRRDGAVRNPRQGAGDDGHRRRGARRADAP